MRATRALLATLVVLGLASSAHVLGGGEAPGVLAGIALALLVGPVAWWVGRTRVGTLRLAGLLGAAQLLVHTGLTLMAPGSGSGSPLHVHGGLPTGLGETTAAVTHAHHRLGVPMLLAHLVATVVTAVVLGRVEDVLWRVVRLLLPAVPAPVRVAAPARVPCRSFPVVLTGCTVRPLGGRAPPVALA